MAVVLPFTFSNGTVANATQVNANFNALAGAALDPNLPVTFTGTVQFNGAATFRGDVSIASSNVSAIGGPWLIKTAAGALNPANPWNLHFSQGVVEPMRLWTVSGGGVTVCGELDVILGDFYAFRDAYVWEGFYNWAAVEPPNPQNVGPGSLGLKPLALWDRDTGALQSLGNMSHGVTGSWGPDNLVMIAMGGSPYFIMGKAGGTAAVPATPTVGDNLARFVGTGYVGGGDWTFMPWAVRMNFRANENWSMTAQGTRIIFENTPNGSVASQEAAIMEHNGNFTIFGSTATKPGSTAWVNPSDPRLKNYVEPYGTGLDQLVRLNPIRYRYNGKGPLQGYMGEHVGLDADHVAEVMPSLHGSMEYEGESYGTVDSGELIYTLLNAVKELATEIAALKKRG